MVYEKLKICNVIEDTAFYNKFLEEKLMIWESVKTKLATPIFETEKQYFDDPDNPPLPVEFKIFQFVECAKYMTLDGIITFNFNYIIQMYLKLEGRLIPGQ
jgi:hypothetical protein